MEINNLRLLTNLQKKTLNLTLFIFFGALILQHSNGFAQGETRWFQIEISIFSNQLTADRDSEFWAPDKQLTYPESVIALKTVSDILTPSDWAISVESSGPIDFTETDINSFERPLAENNLNMGSSTPFRLISIEKDAFLSLPPRFSDFEQTNQALHRSTEYRLLKHLVWRQPMPEKKNAIPILIDNNDNISQSEEIGGSVMVYFNRNKDRIVVDSNLWLLNLDAPRKDDTWEIPPFPKKTGDANNIQRNANLVYELTDQREVRSGEFHYIDHPAFGYVVSITRHAQPEE